MSDPQDLRRVHCSSNDVINISDVIKDMVKINKLSSATEHRHLPVRLQPSLEVKCKPEHATEVQEEVTVQQVLERQLMLYWNNKSMHVLLFLRDIKQLMEDNFPFTRSKNACQQDFFRVNVSRTSLKIFLRKQPSFQTSGF